MERVIWYLKRLAVMGPREILHRIGEQMRVAAMRRAHRRGGAPDPAVDLDKYGFRNAVEMQLPSLDWGDGPDPAVHSALLSGQGAALGFDWVWSDDADTWRRAPDTGSLWPVQFFADVPYRAGNPHGDARVVWEPARLQHLVALALLARDAGAEDADAAVAMIERQFRSWLAANPPWAGVHYISAMECGLRLIAVCHALDLVRGRLPDREVVWRDLLSLVTSHAPFILHRLSLYSSAGNHTIAEAAALVYAGMLFPELAGAGTWKARGLDLLRREAARQVLPDGGGIERTFTYHRFILDLLGLVAALLSHNGEPVPDEIAGAVARGRRFLAGVTVGSGVLPPVGDSDGGYALSPYLAWPAIVDAGEAVPVISFPESGHTVLRMDEDRLMLLFDHGPLGMAPGFGHAHADALSIVAYCGDAPLLLDPGTFTYTGDPEWRRYFRGTRAHNTVEVEGQDQARQETAFQWSRPYGCELLRSETHPDGGVRLLARHDGYSALGVIHWRGIVYRPGKPLLVWDRLVGAAERRLALHWHCADTPAGSEGGFRLVRDGRAFSLAIHGGVTTVHRGAVDPALGWNSPAYGVRMPLTTLRTEYCGALPHEFITLLGFSTEALNIDAAGDDIRILRDWTGAAGAG